MKPHPIPAATASGPEQPRRLTGKHVACFATLLAAVNVALYFVAGGIDNQAAALDLKWTGSEIVAAAVGAVTISAFAWYLITDRRYR